MQTLRNWNEVGDATAFLRRRDLPLHSTPEKNWDLKLLTELAEGLPRDAAVIDLGCSGLHSLRLLRALGFTRLRGIDLHFTLDDFLSLARLWIAAKSVRCPLSLRLDDMTADQTVEDESQDLAVALSSIEHGVDLPRFLLASYRILKDGGLLFVTTDYWADGRTVAPSVRPFGFPWRVFDETAIHQFLHDARKVGFEIGGPAQVPACEDPVVFWNNTEYTFLSIVLKKSQSKHR